MSALAAIGRRPLAWLAVVLVAGLALGAVLLLAISFWSLRPLAQAASIAPQATVLVAAGATAAEADTLRGSIALLPTVVGTRFISRDAALAQIVGRTPADREAIGQLAVNPLPDVVVVNFRQDARPDAMEATAAVIRKMARVDGVELDLAWYRKFLALARIGIAVSVAAVGALAVHAAGWLIVAVSVSAPIDARRAQLLWLLGADDRAVRRAPVAAAGLTALTVAAVALTAARIGWLWLNRELGSIGPLYATAVKLQWPAPSRLAAFVAAVWVAGALIGSIRARLRLRAIRGGVAL
jgi:cell division protein FtsX